LTHWLTRAAAGTSSAADGAPSHSELPIAIPGFDTNDTMDRLAGDVELYHSVLQMLVPTLSSTLTQFDDALAASDRERIKSTVHSVRGMAANVGATALSDCATALEQGLNGNQERPEQLAVFRALIEDTLRVVEQGLAQRKVA
ncbi:MAG: Hpt domain-containing protein, partial [Noviherbaspirillum sp.]